MRRTALACALVMTATIGPARAGGDLDFRDPAPPSGSTHAAEDPIGRFISDLFDPAPAAAESRPLPRPPAAQPSRPSRTTAGVERPSSTPPPVPSPASAAATLAAETPNTAPPPSAGRIFGLDRPLPAPIVPPTDANPITTAGLPPVRGPEPLSPVDRDDALDSMFIGEADRDQARLDIIKLELAGRAYNEPRLSGQPAFETRPHWRVLERARDALSDSKLTAARAVGFEANAYINERDKLIVVAIAGTQDLKRDFLTADIWEALIRAQAPQQFFMSKVYVRSVMQRYQVAGFTTECVGHSLGGGACAYAASELGIKATVVNPISAGRLSAPAYQLVTNYIVDGDIARRIYEWRGNKISGNILLVDAGREELRQRFRERYGALSGPVRVVRDLKDAVSVHSLEKALDLIAAQTGGERVR